LDAAATAALAGAVGLDAAATAALARAVGLDAATSSAKASEVAGMDPAGVGTSLYRAVFGVMPEFGRDANMASFDASYLDRPLPLANSHAVAMCEAQCRELVSRRRARSGFAHDVRESLTRLGALSSRMPDVARQLNISTRTLRRRLEEEGTTFRALLDEVREALAEELLAAGAVPVEDVATRLGYAEASSFIHAFKRWKGVTPTAFAQRRRGSR
jgi:AraC-like DNA-binding protein